MSGRELCDVVGNALAHRGAFAVVDLEALLLESERKSAHGSDEEVGALNMPGTRCDFARRLNDEDTVCVGLCCLQRTDIAIELIAKNPNGAQLADIGTNVEHVSSFGAVRDRIHTEFATREKHNFDP